jgi:hypothetical protein
MPDFWSLIYGRNFRRVLSILQRWHLCMSGKKSNGLRKTTLVLHVFSRQVHIIARLLTDGLDLSGLALPVVNHVFAWREDVTWSTCSTYSLSKLPNNASFGLWLTGRLNSVGLMTPHACLFSAFSHLLKKGALVLVMSVRLSVCLSVRLPVCLSVTLR